MRESEKDMKDDRVAMAMFVIVLIFLAPLLIAAVIGWWDMTRDIFCPNWLASGRVYECRDWPIWRRP